MSIGTNFVFTPTQFQFPQIPTLPIGDPTKIEDKDDDAKCPFVETTPAQCILNPTGEIKLHLDLTSNSGCKLFPPLYVYLNDGDGDIVTGFSGAVGSEHQFYLPPDNYKFFISGSAGSSMDIDATVGAVGLIVSGYSVEHVAASDCFGSGSFRARWSGEYSYFVEENISIAGTSTTGFSCNLPVGDYILHLQHGPCEAASNFAIEVLNPLVTTTQFSGFSCSGNGHDGIGRVLPVGGHPPYAFQWMEAGTTGILSTGALVTGLGEGFYTSITTDSHGCQDYQNISIIQNSSLSASLQFTTQVQNTICCQAIKTQFASIYAVIGGGFAPFQYLWNNGFTGAQLTGCSIGEYYCKVTDSHGCSVTTATQKITLSDECLKVRWEFGDGHSQEDTVLPENMYNAVGNFYTSPGTYNVKFKAVDTQGRQGIVCHSVNVPVCTGTHDGGPDTPGHPPKPPTPTGGTVPPIVPPPGPGGNGGDSSPGDPPADTPCACCHPCPEGTCCDVGYTVGSCRGAGGQVVTINNSDSGHPSVSCGNIPALPGCAGKRVCRPKTGGCCIEDDGCIPTSKCECNDRKGTWNPDALTCENCLVNCCVTNGNTLSCNPGQTKKQCADMHGKPVSDCEKCQGSSSNCCQEFGGCPSETGDDCTGGCCCCPVHYKCGAVANGIWTCVPSLH